MKTLITALAVTLGAVVYTGCTDASVVSQNLSKKADMFEVNRRIIFYNGITGKYMLTINGLCSIHDSSNQLEVTCKTGPESYKKHFLGLSDNVTYFAEQLQDLPVNKYHYKVIFKPSVIIPDVDVKL